MRNILLILCLFDRLIATTVDVERLFSTGRVLLGYLRNRLSADSVHSILCLKSWWDAGVIQDDLFSVGVDEAE